MKYKEIKINNILFNDNYIIYDYQEDEDIHLYIKSKKIHTSIQLQKK